MPVSLKTAPMVGAVGKTHIPRTAEDSGASHCLGPARGSTAVTFGQLPPPTTVQRCLLLVGTLPQGFIKVLVPN